jgi:acetylornithine deacetylase/succinyl-diaminopimelate desuccinylase-like protein
MKVQGAQLVAFLMLKRQNAADPHVILMAEPDEEVGGALGAQWMIANRYAELVPCVIDEGGFGSRDLFSAEQDGLRI